MRGQPPSAVRRAKFDKGARSKQAHRFESRSASACSENKFWENRRGKKRRREKSVEERRFSAAFNEWGVGFSPRRAGKPGRNRTMQSTPFSEGQTKFVATMECDKVSQSLSIDVGDHAEVRARMVFPR